MYRALHPLMWWIWAGCLAIGVAMTSSPLLALLVVGVVAIIVKLKASATAWKKSFYWALRLGLWILGIRIVIGLLIGVPVPGRTLFSLPIVPLPSWMAGIRLGGAVTLERLSATAHEGFMIASIIALLGAAASLSSPHRLLRCLPIMIYEFGVAVVIATTVVPQLVVSTTRIRQAQHLRGQNLRGVHLWRAVALPLLEDALSRSLDLAAAMDSRGYGLRPKRSRYRPDKFRASEYIILALSMLIIIKPTYFLLIASLSPLLLAPRPNEKVFA